MTGAHAARVDGINACKIELEDKMLSMKAAGATSREIGGVQSILVLVKREGRSEAVMYGQNEKLWKFKCGDWV